VFYGRARRDGEDVRVELRRAKQTRASTTRTAQSARPAGASVETAVVGPKSNLRAATQRGVLILALLLSAAGPTGTAASAAEPDHAKREIAPARLDRAINEVLTGSEFTWRLRPAPRENQEMEEGPVKRFMQRLIDGATASRRWLSKLWRSIRDWFMGPDPVTPPEARDAGGTVTLERVLWALVIVIGGGLIAVLVIAWRRRGQFRNPVLTAQATMPTPAPDLRDETTQAAQLPTDGWLALARAQLAAGEGRLAWRALYLATLAQLAAQGLIDLKRSKTNLDYERELRRRAIARQELVTWFSGRRGAFEAVWYGRALAEESFAREWLGELERPSSP
jgi:hypothetical protein